MRNFGLDNSAISKFNVYLTNHEVERQSKDTSVAAFELDSKDLQFVESNENIE